MKQRDRVSMDIAMKHKKAACEAKISVFSEFGKDWVSFTLPIVTVSEANGGVKEARKVNGKIKYRAEHWTEKHRRHKLQQGSVSLMLRPMASKLRMPCHITLTRYAPRMVDKFDNLPMAFKYILDIICAVISGDNRPGRADSHEGLVVTYEQELTPKYGIKVHIKNI
jgi:hypothetical protein